MTRQEMMERLWPLQDEAYRKLQKKLIPGAATEKVIGVRTPALRALAKEAARQADTAEFLRALPHEYFDENQLHAFIISEEKNAPVCFRRVEAFLPFVDNWATCDQLSPKCFKKHRAELLEYIEKWLEDSHPYTVRFGIGMLMQHFLEEDFEPRFLDWVAGVQSEAYYVNMMIAWYFATALTKQYDAALPYIENRSLALWTHNKTIQKAIESYRISNEQKAYLRTLKTKAFP